MAKYGIGDCPDCGRDFRLTKDGRVPRHGFIRIKRGFKRVHLPECKEGHTYYPCPGSGQKAVYAVMKK